MNGARIKRSEDGNCIYVELPKAVQRVVTDGACSCAFCKAHPWSVPMWDTLAVPTRAPDELPDTAWTVHAPEMWV